MITKEEVKEKTIGRPEAADRSIDVESGDATKSVQPAKWSFTDFNLRDELLKAIARKGFESPMPVQIRVLEDETLTEGDLIVQAKTGSGKTLAFALPLLNQLRAGTREPQVLVLSPTRELAQQTAREFAWLGADLGVKPAALVGGMDMERQVRALREGANVIVGTPGRVLDHLRRSTFKTGAITSLVLDEGDHMLDMGFRDELEAILNQLENVDRTWLFSATMPEDVLALSRRYLDAPRKISLVCDIVRHEDITQRTYIIPARKRFEGLANVLLWEAPRRALLFCATRVETQETADRLCDEGFRACAIHGDMSQRERNAALASLRGGRVSFLVATDVAARGLDIEGISHVIQFGLPGNLEAFVHRSGRTGRAGNEGQNLLLLTAREARAFRDMSRGANLQMEWLPAPDALEVEGQSRSRFEQTLLEHSLDDEEYLKWTDELLGREDLRDVMSGLLAKAYGEHPQGYSIRVDVEAEMNREKSRRASFPSSGSRDGARPARAGMGNGVTVSFAEGRADGWEVGALLGALCRALGISREDVGNIRLRDNSATVELSESAASRIESRRDRLKKERLVVSAFKAITPRYASSERPSAPHSRSTARRTERPARREWRGEGREEYSSKPSRRR